MSKDSFAKKVVKDSIKEIRTNFPKDFLGISVFNEGDCLSNGGSYTQNNKTYCYACYWDGASCAITLNNCNCP